MMNMVDNVLGADFERDKKSVDGTIGRCYNVVMVRILRGLW